MTGDDATTAGNRDGSSGTVEENDDIEYGIDDRPPIGESTVLGIQHYLTMVGANIAVPLILAGAMGMPGDVAARFIGTFFVVSGIATLAQTTFGNRYPIVQGAPFSMLAPALAIITVVTAGGVGAGDWETALLQLQGAIIVAATVQVAMGYFGLVGKLRRFLSPVVIAPTIALIGLALFNVDQVTQTDQSWLLLGFTLGLIVLFSQYLDVKHRAFRLYPVIIAVGLAWGVAAMLSATGTIGGGHPGHISFAEVTDASLLMPIYPFQWGIPEVTTAFVIGMFAGVLAPSSRALVTTTPSPTSLAPPHQARSGSTTVSGWKADERLLGDHGNRWLDLLLREHRRNRTHRRRSRYVVQIGAVFMLIFGFIGYFGQLIATIPDPIIGGLFIAMFAQIVAVGIGNLRHVDLESSRNVFIIGFALFVGLAIPAYMGNFETTLEFRDAVGVEAMIASLTETALVTAGLAGWLEAAAIAVADTIYIIGSTGMAVGGLAALFLDNTIPGTREERGLAEWNRIAEDDAEFEPFWERWVGDDESSTDRTE